MATQGKDQHGPAGRREKRGVSPSPHPQHTNHSTTTNRIRSPSAPSPRIRPPDQKHTLPTTPSDQKTRIPNYLKPTMSSAPNPSIQGKTQPPSSNKPTLNRRRSFDKPPSPITSRLQKSHTIVAPKTSSSSLPKPHHEKFLLKAQRDAGKSSHSIISGNKNKNIVNKQSIDATCIVAPNSSSPDIASGSTTPEVECHKEDQESSVTDVEDEGIIIKVEETNDELPLAPIVSVLEEDQNEDLKPIESPAILEDCDESLDVHMEEAEDEEEKLVEETRKDESRQEESSGVGKPIVDVEDKEGEESAIENKEGEVDEGSQLTESKEREEVEDVGKEAKPKAENVAGKGKKETQAYNDVIEETASKLLEKRKNKVKALVGAFETVISLQEPEA